MSVYELAKKYYPRLWSTERVKALYENEKLTKEEFSSIVGDAAQGGAGG